MKPGTRAVLDLLRRKPEGVTALDALDEVGSFRLGARVFELREMGYAIDSDWVTTKTTRKRIARYVLREQMELGIGA